MDDGVNAALDKLRVHIGYCSSHGGIGLDAVQYAAATIRRLDADNAALRDDVASVLAQLDELAATWGDEARFRRCRDRLRAAIQGEAKGEDEG